MSTYHLDPMGNPDSSYPHLGWATTITPANYDETSTELEEVADPGQSTEGDWHTQCSLMFVGLSRALYQQVVHAACEAATRAAMRAIVRDKASDLPSSHNIAPNTPSSDRDELETYGPFEHICRLHTYSLYGQIILLCSSPCEEEGSSCQPGQTCGCM